MYLAPDPAMRAPRSAEVRAFADCADIVAAWDALANEAGTANPFYTHAAVAAALPLPEAAPPRVLLVWEGRALIGALPVATRTKRGVSLAVENWDQRVRALGEPLIRAGAEHVFWQAALPLLARERGLYLRLSALDADSPSTRALHAVCARPIYETRRYERAMLAGGVSSADHTAAHVRGKVLKEHRRLRARLDERGGLAFERLAPDGDVDAWIDDLFRLEASGWKGREGVDAGADPATDHCFRTMIRDAHRAGTLDFHRMTVGGQPVSLLANLESGDEAFQLKITYNEAFAASSPGVLLEMAYLAHALDVRRLARVDSCARAGHPMIDRIWPARRAIVSLAIPFDNPASRLFCAAADRWRRRPEEPA